MLKKAIQERVGRLEKKRMILWKRRPFLLIFATTCAHVDLLDLNFNSACLQISTPPSFFSTNLSHLVIISSTLVPRLLPQPSLSFVKLLESLAILLFKIKPFPSYLVPFLATLTRVNAPSFENARYSS